MSSLYEVERALRILQHPSLHYHLHARTGWCMLYTPLPTQCIVRRYTNVLVFGLRRAPVPCDRARFWKGIDSMHKILFPLSIGGDIFPKVSTVLLWFKDSTHIIFCSWYSTFMFIFCGLIQLAPPMGDPVVVDDMSILFYELRSLVTGLENDVYIH